MISKRQKRDPVRELVERDPVCARIVDQLEDIYRRPARKKSHYWPRRLFDDDGERLYLEVEAAEMIGCAKGSVARWANGGWIPNTKRGNTRVFTRHQIFLLERFYAIPKHDHDARSEVSKYIFENW